MPLSRSPTEKPDPPVRIATAVTCVTIRRRPPMVQCGSVDERLGRCGSALMAFDQVNQRLDPKVGKRHDAVVPCTIDPDQSVLLVHFDGDVPSPTFIFPEHLGN